ncbi:MAG TPA: hypothetical protein VHK88_09105, partial [Aquihabitans sp.]|nr:hypothetical protein [Aquihabitans sp.]
MLSAVEGRARGLRPTLVGLVVLGAGLAITVGLTAAAARAHRDNEDRLLAERTRQAAAVLEGSVPGVEAPLATSAGLAEVLAPGLLDATLGTQVGPEERFVSASIWPVEGGEPRAVVGAPPALADQDPAAIREFLALARSNDGMSVLDLLDGPEPRLGYAHTVEAERARFVVYAEQALPRRRTEVVQPDSAFTGLDYALHLGDRETAGTLLAASTDDLPLDGRRAEE